MKPYYEDESVTLYHGDCRDVTDWLLAADVLVTDPPYGRGWYQHAGLTDGNGQGSSKAHAGIANDHDTSTRDDALRIWGDRPGIVFGDLLRNPPAQAVQALIYGKPADAGVKGARAGCRRDVEAIYLTGPWPAGIGGRTSIFTTRAWVAGPSGQAAQTGHPHAKPIDLMCDLLALTTGVVADPFAGAGATLFAAKYVGRRAIGVELDEAYCEIAARRLAQDNLFEGTAS